MSQIKEILIGRDSSRTNYVVPWGESLVSRMHARLIMSGDKIAIEDMESTNGTYVNGIRVEKKLLMPGDEVTLGSANGFKLNVQEVINGGVAAVNPAAHPTPAPTPKPASAPATDPGAPLSDVEYSRRVMALEQVYEDYQSEMARLNSKGQSTMMMKRMGPTMLLGVVTSVASVLAPEDAKVAVAVGGSIATVFVFLLANQWASKSTLSIAEKKKNLTEQFELDYVCPSCHNSFKGSSFKALQAMHCCKFCKRKF